MPPQGRHCEALVQKVTLTLHSARSGVTHESLSYIWCHVSDWRLRFLLYPPGDSFPNVEVEVSKCHAGEMNPGAGLY